MNMFDEIIKERSHERPEDIIEHNIEKSSNMNYTLDVPTELHIIIEKRNIFHNKMFKLKGAIKFGLIQRDVDCSGQSTV